jgi:hypothetical protein
MSPQTEWDFEIEVGRGKVRGRVQLLRANFYSLIDNILSQQIVTGDSRTLGMQIGRIKDALVLNGVVTETINGKARKPLTVTHPDINAGEAKRFFLHGDEPLYYQPLVADDGEWMSKLGDKIAGVVVEKNPGLEVKYGESIFGLFKEVPEDEEKAQPEDDEVADDPTDFGIIADEEEVEEEAKAEKVANPT